jgi:hypothetical protein
MKKKNSCSGGTLRRVWKVVCTLLGVGRKEFTLKVLLTLCIVSLAFFTACSDDTPASSGNDDLVCSDTFEPKGNRLLGIDFLNQTETGTFEEDLDRARRFGVEFTGLHLLWNQIETATQVYSDPGDVLDGLGSFCSANDLKLALTIRPIDLTGKTVPADLSTTRFNSEEMKTRFKHLLDFVFTKIDFHLLTSLQIGNEIDGFDTGQEDPDFWSDYGSFLFEMRTYIDDQFPGLKVGFTVTLLGVTEGTHQSSGVFEALDDVVHVVGVTYYPLNTDFTVMDPDVVGSHFDAIVSKFEGKTIYLQEVGFQTSAECSSSERDQAQFICNIFQAWDDHLESIELVEFVRMNDVSPEMASEMAGPYGIDEVRFTEYLRTLGLRTHGAAGADKQAFSVLVEQAQLRGWTL